MINSEVNLKELLTTLRRYTLIIFDFDYTLTTAESESSIGVFTKYLPKRYKVIKKFFDFIIEKITNKKLLAFMWMIKLKFLSIFLDLKLLNSVRWKKDFKLRNDIKKILEELFKQNIPIIIYSSGMKIVIERILESNKLFFNNITIFANDVDFTTKKIKNKIITPKKEKLQISNSKNVLVFGDKSDDLFVVDYATRILVKEKLYFYGG